ncbi:MAG: hypothetical protein PHC44_02230 [Lutispora sp.]|nr:hypothetical protein [Lutispora sp.]MDD4833532.1 hypothetical protein [Lutispora sp.]
MSIRSIDFQVLIPKTPEVQKIKYIENESQKINQQINMIKDSENKTKELKKVKKADKAYESRIDKDGKNSKSKSDGEECDKQNKKKKGNRYIKESKIDIRI